MSNLSELIPAGGGQNNTDFVADGAITSGKPVILNGAGTVTEVGESAGSETLGGPVDANDVLTKGYGVDICYDSGNDRLVAIWFRNSDKYPIAAVGTVSGTTTTWGTPVVIESVVGDAQPIIDYSPDDGKVLAVYTGASPWYPRGIVGTVSGTTTTWGSATTVNSESSSQYHRMTYDTGNNQFLVISFGGVSPYNLTVTIGTITGTSVAFTGSTVFASGGAQDYPMGIAYDENAAAFAILYRNSANQQYGTTGTSDGSSLTLGSTSLIGTWNSGGTGDITYDSTAQKCVAVWKNTSGYGAGAVITVVGGGTRSFTAASETTFNSSAVGSDQSMHCTYATAAANITTVIFTETSDNYPRFCNGTVTGTAIAFNTVARLWTDNAGNSRNNICPIASGKVAIIAQSSTTIGSMTNNYASVNVLQNVATATNLTATNLLGIASAAILDTATGTINTWGSRNEVQTSLTIASDYYVQNDGTITTSSSGQLIGEAITATQINIKDYTG